MSVMWNSDIANLTRQEASVAEYAQRNPLQFATSTGADIAAKTGTSEASVARAARKQGLANVREMKTYCASCAHESANLQSVLNDRLKALGSSSRENSTEASATVLRDAATLVLGLEATASSAAIHSAVLDIARSRRTYIYGLGTALCFADYAEIELTRVGVDARSITGGGHTNSHAAFQVTDQDTLVVLAPRILFADVKNLIHSTLREVSQVHLVTQATLPAELASKKINVLRLPHSGGYSATDAVSTIALGDVLVAEFARHAPARALEARARAQDYRDEFSK